MVLSAVFILPVPLSLRSNSFGVDSSTVFDISSFPQTSGKCKNRTHPDPGPSPPDLKHFDLRRSLD